MMRVYLVPTIKKEGYEKKKGNHLYDQKEKGEELWYLNFLHLLEDCVSLTLCPITNFFKTRTGLSMKIKTHIVTLLSFEYGKDNYLGGDKMTDQTVNLTTRIFPYAFPDCQALFAFDNAANHACFAENALLAKKMNLGVGGKQPRMRDGFNDAIQ